VTQHNISMRPKGGGAVYSPQRDWAHCLPAIVKRVSLMFQQDAWPVVYDTVAAALSDTTGETASAELIKAHDAYHRFLTNCTKDCKQTIYDVLEESGFLDVAPAAQVGYLAMLANIFTGHIFEGLRDITELGEIADPIKELDRYTSTGLDTRRILNKMTKGDDLKVDLATILRLLRNEDVSWSVIDRIINRERQLDPDMAVK
jgi:hypothetical protein